MESIGKALETALKHYERKEYEDALRIVDAMLLSYPDFNRALFLKGVILQETGRTDEGEVYFHKAGPLIPLWHRLALQLQDIDPDRALHYFIKASTLDDSDNGIWLGMGKIYENRGDFEAAGRCYARLSLGREMLSRILGPVGFLVLMLIGTVMLIGRGNIPLASLVVISSFVCLLWLKRDGGRFLEMLSRKKKFGSSGKS